ncbi:hypothetical protein IFM89_007080 [Coptis chinensis]|uniref:Uncharacterized protein n=1 Tax=Coptis chinensis TaxID=261450 RepID=A0A835H3U5_9MAGN|nr:hypothetical protein IFM89_007080 [Coptis chinensis]
MALLQHHCIAAIDSSNRDWKILASVSRLWEAVDYSTDEVTSLVMLLIDEQHVVGRIIVWNKLKNVTKKNGHHTVIRVIQIQDEHIWKERNKVQFDGKKPKLETASRLFDLRILGNPGPSGIGIFGGNMGQFLLTLSMNIGAGTTIERVHGYHCGCRADP